MKYFLIAFTLFLNSCSNKIQQKTENEFESKVDTQHLIENLTLQQQIDQLKKSMLEYMETGQPSYSKLDVDKCVGILENYVAEIEKTKSKEDAMDIVKSTILKLNDLNATAKSELIETVEREQIAIIIITATHKKGYNSMEEDITEKWREW